MWSILNYNYIFMYMYITQNLHGTIIITEFTIVKNTVCTVQKYITHLCSKFHTKNQPWNFEVKSTHVRYSLERPGCECGWWKVIDECGSTCRGCRCGGFVGVDHSGCRVGTLRHDRACITNDVTDGFNEDVVMCERTEV